MGIRSGPFQVLDAYDLAVAMPGQQTTPPDHGVASGSFTVLQGELTEEYRYPGGPIRGRSHVAGEGIGLGAGRAHRSSVRRGNAPAASVHAYTAPLVHACEYASLADVPAEVPPLPAVLGD